jgi:hypothetical protein
VAKRIEPLSSRAQIVAKANEEKAPGKSAEVTPEKATTSTVVEPAVETAPVEKLPPPRQMGKSVDLVPALEVLPVQLRDVPDHRVDHRLFPL